jgi:hypothetical protein
MALRILKADDPMVIEHVNLCIYGAPGLGKTSMAFTAADPILLDFDGGSHRAVNRKDTVQIKSWAEVTNITPEDLQPYKTVVVDTAGRALDFLTTDIIAGNPKMGRGGALTLQGYGELKSKFASWMKMLRTFGKDVVLIAHMDEQRSGDDVVERLDVQGSSKGEIYKSVDAMGRIYMQGKARVLDFSPRENSFGKNPCGLEILPFPSPSENPELLKQLIASMKEQMNKLTENQKASQRELEEWAIALQDFEIADDFNRCLEDVQNASIAVKSMFNKKAKDLGFAFNKKARQYEDAHAVVS